MMSLGLRCAVVEVADKLKCACVKNVKRLVKLKISAFSRTYLYVAKNSIFVKVSAF